MTSPLRSGDPDTLILSHFGQSVTNSFRMSGMEKNERRPSYERGEVDDPKIVEMQEAAAGDDQRLAFMRLIRRVTRKPRQ